VYKFLILEYSGFAFMLFYCFLVPARLVKLNYSFTAISWLFFYCVCSPWALQISKTEKKNMVLEFHVLNTPDLQAIAFLVQVRTFLDKIIFALPIWVTFCHGYECAVVDTTGRSVLYFLPVIIASFLSHSNSSYSSHYAFKVLKNFA